MSNAVQGRTRFTLSMTSSSCTQRRSTRITSNCRAGLGKAALCRLAVALLSSEEEAGRVLGSLGFLEVSVVIEREQGLAMTNDSSTTSFQQSADIIHCHSCRTFRRPLRARASENAIAL